MTLSLEELNAWVVKGKMFRRDAEKIMAKDLRANILLVRQFLQGWGTDSSLARPFFIAFSQKPKEKYRVIALENIKVRRNTGELYLTFVQCLSLA